MKTFKQILNENNRPTPISTDTAKFIGLLLGVDFDKVDLEEFRMGLEVEQEHGYGNPRTDVTSPNMFSVFAKIALAHLDELPDYYTRLKKMESE